MLVGEREICQDLEPPVIQGRAYADLEWILAAIVRGKCSAPVERTQGEQSACCLWVHGLDDPNQDCVAAWGTITGDQQAP